MIRSSKNLNFAGKILKLNISDHFGLELNIQKAISVFKSRNKDVFYKLLDHGMLSWQLLLSNWSAVFNENDDSKSVCEFYRIFSECHTTSCSLKQ